MNSKEALAIVELALCENCLNENRLNKLQKAVFCHAWEEQSYGEIARCSGYELGYVKQTGSQLWQLLSRVFSEKVTKTNVQSVVQRQLAIATAANRPHPLDTHASPLHSTTLLSPVATSAAGIVPTAGIPAPAGIPNSSPTVSNLTLASRPLHVDSAPVPTQSLDPLDSPDPAVSTRTSTFATPVTAPTTAPTLPTHIDWGDAVNLPAFYGRAAELATLISWIMRDRCRLISILGMGGIGKTSLSVKLAKHLLAMTQDGERDGEHPSSFTLNHPTADGYDLSGLSLSPPSQASFRYVVWRSLRNAPPIQDLLTDLVQVLSNRQEVELPETLDERIRRLLHYLRQHRCLIILDNGETVMRQGDRGGGYLAGYEGYGQLLRSVGEADHQSIVVLTSREKPGSLAAKEGEGLPIRSLRLRGLSAEVGQELFSLKGEFTGSATEWKTLTDHYAGNPLALKMLAPVIQDLFDGEIGSFLGCLHTGTSVFGDIRDLLAQQLNRLSESEQQVMDWLAIARKPVTLSQLRDHFAPPIGLGDLLEAMTSLERRCLIDKTTPRFPEKTQTCFTLQPAVMEYVTERLIEQVCGELVCGEIICGELVCGELVCGELVPMRTGDAEQTDKSGVSPELRRLQSHALLLAQTKDYIRETQTRLIVQPIADRLLAHYTQAEVEGRLRNLLAELQRRSPRSLKGYAGGNILNLLCQLGTDLTGWDFSRLAVWNAYLRRVNLHGVNLTGADLSKSAFTETFSQILAIAFSPDSKLLATGDVNHEIHLWQVADSKQLLSVKVEEGWVWSLAFSPDGRTLASTANRSVRLWDVQTGDCIRALEGFSDRVFSVAFSPDGQFLATGSEDHLVRLWNPRTGDLLRTLEGHSDEVRCVAFSPDSVSPTAHSLLLASASYDGTVRLWDAKTGEALQVLVGHSHWVRSVAFSPDGHTLASAGDDGVLRLWNVVTGECLNTLDGHLQPIRTVAFSPDGRTLASGSDDGTLRLWNYHSGDCLRVLTGHSSWVSAIAFSPDGVLASGSEDQSVRLWDSRTSHCLKTLQGYSNGVWSVAFDPHSPVLASGSQDRTIRLWHRHTGALVSSFHGHTRWVWSVAYNPTGDRLASGSEDQTVRLWNTRSHQPVCVLEGHRDAVLAVLFTPDGRRVISGSLDGTIKLWDVQTEQCLQTLRAHTGGIWSLALSRDGQMLVSGSQDQTVKLWDVATGTCLATLEGHHSWIRSVALSPDRHTIVSGSADGVIKQWNVGDRTCTRTLFAHRGPVLTLDVHPTGSTFASGSTDTTVKLWASQSGQCLQTLDGHQRWVRHLAFSTDGQTLASCSQDETIRLWNVVNCGQEINENGSTEDELMRQASSCSQILRIPRPYEGMAIAQVTGLTNAQKSTLKMLGAVDAPLTPFGSD